MNGVADFNAAYTVTLTDGPGQVGQLWYNTKKVVPGFSFSSRVGFSMNALVPTNPSQGFCVRWGGVVRLLLLLLHFLAACSHPHPPSNPQVMLQNDVRGKEAMGDDSDPTFGISFGVDNPDNIASIDRITPSVGVCVDVSMSGTSNTVLTYGFTDGNASYCPRQRAAKPYGNHDCTFNATAVSSSSFSALPTFFSSNSNQLAGDIVISMWLVGDTEVHWSLVDYDSDTAYGSYMMKLPSIKAALGGQTNAWFGFSGATQTGRKYSTIYRALCVLEGESGARCAGVACVIVSSPSSSQSSPVNRFAFSTLDNLVAQPDGGTPYLAVGHTAPTSVDTYNYDEFSSNPFLGDGDEVMIVDGTKSYFTGLTGTTYYFAVWCDGPATCKFDFNANEGHEITPSPTRRPPSASISSTRSPAATPNLQPSNLPFRPQDNSDSWVLNAQLKKATTSYFRCVH